MSGFVAELLSRSENEVPPFVIGLTDSEKRNALGALTPESFTTDDELAQGRLIKTSAFLQLALSDLTAGSSVAADLIWPPEQSVSSDPRALLDASSDWQELLWGAPLDALYLARVLQMKHLALRAPVPEAHDLRAKALEICCDVVEHSAVRALQNDARFLRANLLVDSAPHGRPENAAREIAAAVSLYEDLLLRWPLEFSARHHLLVTSNLATCYKDRSSGTGHLNAEEDMSRALALFEKTVNLAKQHDLTEIAANARFSMAAAYFGKAHRENGAQRDASLSASIANFEDLREIWSNEEQSGARLKAMVNQSVVMTHRGRTRTARGGLQDFAAAAALCSEAIEIFTSPGNEGDLARAWAHRANAFWSMSRRKTGRFARDDLETALSSHLEADKIWTRLDSDRARADCLMDQAIVLSCMAESEIGYEALRLLDRAIGVFDRAYNIKTELGDRAGAARVARNLATAWFERAENTTGARARADLSRAIELYGKAIAPWDENIDGPLIAEINAEKAGALMTRAQHQNGAAQLNDLDAAIALLEHRLAQLEHPQDARAIASFSFNCAMAYALRAKRLPADPGDAPDINGPDAHRAVELYQTALDVFAAPEDAVHAFDPAVALAELLVWQAENGSRNVEPLLKRAISCAEQAMRTHDVLLDPRKWLNAAEVYCHALFVAEDDRAEDALKEILHQGRRLVISLPDPEGQETALRALSGVGDRLAILRARQGALSGAFEAVGQGRSIRATRDLSLSQADGPVSERRDAMFAARARVQELDRARAEGDGDAAIIQTYETALSALKTCHSALEEALASDESAYTEADAADPVTLAASLTDDEVLAVPLLSETGGGILLVYNSDAAPVVRFLDLPGLTCQAVDRLLNAPDTGWMGAYATAFDDTRQQLWDPSSDTAGTFMNALDSLLCALWQLIMGPLHQTLKASLGTLPTGSVVLITPGKMAGLPLGAAKETPNPGARPFLCDWAVAYSQSLSAWLSATQMARDRAIHPLKLLAVSDPTEDLAIVRSYAQIDGNWRLAPRRGADGRPDVPSGWEPPGWSLFAPSDRVQLAQRCATIPAVCTAMSTASHAVFFCHGGWDRDRGTRSGLWMASPAPAENNKDAWPGEMLTIARLQQESSDLSRMRVCVLAACETAPVGLTLPDEFDGLAYALSLRVPMVISTLFPVTPTATGLLLRAALTLHLGLPGYPLPVALARTQQAAALGGDQALNHILANGVEHPDPATLFDEDTARNLGNHGVAVPIARATESTMRRAGGGSSIAGELVPDRHPFYWAAYVAIGVAPS